MCIYIYVYIYIYIYRRPAPPSVGGVVYVWAPQRNILYFASVFTIVFRRIDREPLQGHVSSFCIFIVVSCHTHIILICQQSQHTCEYSSTFLCRSFWQVVCENTREFAHTRLHFVEACVRVTWRFVSDVSSPCAHKCVQNCAETLAIFWIRRNGLARRRNLWRPGSRSFKRPLRPPWHIATSIPSKTSDDDFRWWHLHLDEGLSSTPECQRGVMHHPTSSRAWVNNLVPLTEDF